MRECANVRIRELILKLETGNLAALLISPVRPLCGRTINISHISLDYETPNSNNCFHVDSVASKKQ